MPAARNRHLIDTLTSPRVASRNSPSMRSIGSTGFAFLLTSCDRMPVQVIAGSFFPSWLLAAVLGIVAAILIRLLLLWSGVNAGLPVPLLFYPAVAASAAMAIWLLCFI